MLKENSMSQITSLNKPLEENMVTKEMLNITSSCKQLLPNLQNKMDLWYRTRKKFSTREFDKLLNHIISQSCSQPKMYIISMAHSFYFFLLRGFHELKVVSREESVIDIFTRGLGITVCLLFHIKRHIQLLIILSLGVTNAHRGCQMLIAF